MAQVADHGGGWLESWGDLGSPPGGIFTRLSVGVNVGGRLEVFALSGGAIWHIWQQTTGPAWSAWNSSRARTATA